MRVTLNTPFLSLDSSSVVATLCNGDLSNLSVEPNSVVKGKPFKTLIVERKKFTSITGGAMNWWCINTAIAAGSQTTINSASFNTASTTGDSCGGAVYALLCNTARLTIGERNWETDQLCLLVCKRLKRKSCVSLITQTSVNVCSL